MPVLSKYQYKQSGFSIVEVMLVAICLGIVMAGIFAFYNSSMQGYIRIQEEGLLYSQLSGNSQRVSAVLRGLTGIKSASANELQAYAYFSPEDQYASLIRYYLTNGNTKLMADVTPRTADYPNGTDITAQKRTVTIMDNYSAQGNLFKYLDENNNEITNITDTNDIKNITVNLSVKPTYRNSIATTISNTVNLRNRKL